MSRALRRFGLGGITGNATATWVAIGLLLVLLPVPALNNDYITLTFRNILMYAAMSYGWNLIGGYTGYVSFGQVAFFGLGAYSAGVLSTLGVDNLFAYVALAWVVNAVFASALGWAILRLKGHYFGIATLGIGLALADIIGNLDALGGTGGLAVKHVGQETFWIYYYAMWLVAFGSLVATLLIARSKLGYAFVAIRENEDAAAVLGINATRFKITAWVISGMMAGAAGAVFAPANGFIDPPTVFSVDSNVLPIVMTILGGAGTVGGPFIGALILAGMNELLQRAFLQIHTLFFGGIIVAVVLLLPRGLVWLLGLRGGFSAWLRSVTVYRA